MTNRWRREDAVVRVVDDDESVRRALSLFLTMAERRVETFESAEAFLRRETFEAPGCAVVDIRMPGMSGIELHRELIARGVRLPVIFLSAHGDVEMAVGALERGAETFLVKPPTNERLLEAVDRAVERDLEARRAQDEWREALRLWSDLTASEREVAVLIGKGLTNAETAAALGVAERTVRGQRAGVYAKLNVANAVEVSDFLHELSELRRRFGEESERESGVTP